ncbi:MAG: xanthine dehydrogenase family protein subunit M [Beijerinckiaceae bacterium]|nr:xanthine dehydrogenase family protein subunit M [Beijerinckiaceae bacterium]MCI0736483.1 xanthine dehydrogenase family protein subunit M [Beijerinckiaceae bacterium]
MRPFDYQTARDAPEAIALLLAGAGMAGASQADWPAAFLAGGTTLLDLMKLDVLRPRRIVDINALSLEGDAGRIGVTSQGLRLGALVRMSDAAEHPEIKRNYPVLSQSLLSAASSQLRNMATLGGNLLQRTRCPYFRDTSYSECNKRNPGSGCAALDGFNRQHAILGVSGHCIAAYPGDLAQALAVLDASVEILGQGGVRSVPVAELHKRPEATPHIETPLAPGELITAILVPASPFARRSLYLKIRDRDSYQFALASAAVSMDIGDGIVRQVRIALGGIATVPWRAREAEAVLIDRVLDEPCARAAAEAAFAQASPRAHNGFKVALGKETLVRALMDVARLEA